MQTYYCLMKKLLKSKSLNIIDNKLDERQPGESENNKNESKVDTKSYSSGA